VVLSDKTIKQLVSDGQLGITPFVEQQIKAIDGQRVISYGLSSYGYDFRITDKFKIFTNAYNAIIDPMNFNSDAVVDFQGDVCIIPPNSFVLCHTLEWFKIPRDVVTVCMGKSTYARCGLVVNVTPFEPEWEGYATIEISNTTPLPAKVYAWQGVGQLLFLRGDAPCETSYADRKGKYQGQLAQVVTAKV